MVYKIRYYIRYWKRVFLCHYYNFFPKEIYGNIIDAHRIQEDQYNVLSKNDTKNNFQNIFEKKAKVKLDCIDFEPNLCLEVGSESGWFGNALLNRHPGTKYIGIDFRVEVLYKNKSKKIKLVNADVLDIPVKSKSVDTFIAFHVLEHVRDIEIFSQELHRVLKKKAKIIIAVPLGYDTDPCHRWHYMTQHGWNRFIEKKINLSRINHFVESNVPSEYIGIYEKIA